MDEKNIMLHTKRWIRRIINEEEYAIEVGISKWVQVWESWFNNVLNQCIQQFTGWQQAIHESDSIRARSATPKKTFGGMDLLKLEIKIGYFEKAVWATRVGVREAE